MTVLTRDVYQRYLVRNQSQRHYVRIGQAIVLGLLGVAYWLSLQESDLLVNIINLSGSGALQLLPAILGVCFPGGRSLSKAGVLWGLAASVATLWWSLLLDPNPLGIHGGLWGLAANFVVAVAVSAVTKPPSAETVERVHGEVERFVRGDED